MRIRSTRLILFLSFALTQHRCEQVSWALFICQLSADAKQDPFYTDRGVVQSISRHPSFTSCMFILNINSLHRQGRRPMYIWELLFSSKSNYSLSKPSFGLKDLAWQKRVRPQLSPRENATRPVESNLYPPVVVRFHPIISRRWRNFIEFPGSSGKLIHCSILKTRRAAFKSSALISPSLRSRLVSRIRR